MHLELGGYVEECYDNDKASSAVNSCCRSSLGSTQHCHCSGDWCGDVIQWLWREDLCCEFRVVGSHRDALLPSLCSACCLPRTALHTPNPAYNTQQYNYYNQ